MLYRPFMFHSRVYAADILSGGVLQTWSSLWQESAPGSGLKPPEDNPAVVDDDDATFFNAKDTRKRIARTGRYGRS